MKTTRRKMFLTLSAILIGLVSSRCVMYGAPDSPRTELLGRNMNNFVDATKRQREEIDMESHYLVLYIIDGETHLLNTATGVTNHLKAVTASGGVVEYGFIMPGNNLVVTANEHDGSAIVLGDERVIGDPVTLAVYDYGNERLVCERRLYEGYEPTFEPGTEPGVQNRSHLLTGPRFLIFMDMYYPGEGDLFYARIHDEKHIYRKRGEELVENNHANVFRIGDGTITLTERISEDELGERMKGSAVQTGQTYYAADGDELTVFSVEPHSDFLPANYKPEYNGLYVRSKQRKTNLRIMRDPLPMDAYASFPFIWFEGGTRLVHGGTLYDATGEKRESKIVDGTILDIRPVR